MCDDSLDFTARDQLQVPKSVMKCNYYLPFANITFSILHPEIAMYRVETIEASDWEVTSNCYLLIFHQLFLLHSPLVLNVSRTMWKVMQCNVMQKNSHINHRHDTIAFTRDLHLIYTARHHDFFLRARLDVNKINLLVPSPSCHKFTPFPHTFNVFSPFIT